MTIHLLSLLQGAVEYGALAGSKASGLGRFAGNPAVAWVADHLVLIVAVLAVLIIFGFLRPKRRY